LCPDRHCWGESTRTERVDKKIVRKICELSAIPFEQYNTITAAEATAAKADPILLYNIYSRSTDDDHDDHQQQLPKFKLD
jgi:hypothetical protein